MTDVELPQPEAPPVRRRAGRWLLTAVVMGLLAMWGYVLYLAIGPGRQPPPDRLEDPTFAIEAQAECEAAHADVARLPRAVEAADAEERADSIEEADDRFARMLDDLAALAPPGEEGAIVTEWLADWRTYLGDREAYAEALRTDPDAQLLVTAKDRDQITDHLDAFAADNRMPACATPIDV